MQYLALPLLTEPQRHILAAGKGSCRQRRRRCGGDRVVLSRHRHNTIMPTTIASFLQACFLCAPTVEAYTH